jgi:hypothetical protein
MAAAPTVMKTTWELSQYMTAKWMASGTLKITRRKPDMFGRLKRNGYTVYVKPATCHAILQKRDEIASTMVDMMQQDDPEPINIYLWGKYILQLSIFLKEGLDCPYYGLHTLDEDQSVLIGAGINLNQLEYEAFLKMLEKWRLYLNSSDKMCNNFFTNDDPRRKRKIKDVVQPKKSQSIVKCDTQTAPRVMEDNQNPDSDVVVVKKKLKQCTVNSDIQSIPEDMQDRQYPDISPIIDVQLDQITDLLEPDNTYDDVIPPMESVSAKNQIGKEQFTKDQIVNPTVKVYASKTGRDEAQDMKKKSQVVNQTDQVEKEQVMRGITELMKEETEIMELMKKETEPMKEETEQVVKQTDHSLSKDQVAGGGGGAISKISKKIAVTLYGWEWYPVKDDGSIEMTGKAQGDLFVDPKECVNQAMQNRPKYGKYKMNTITRKVTFPINHDLFDAALGRLVQLRQYHHKKMGMPEGHPSAESTILGSISYAEIYDLSRKAIQFYQSVTEMDMMHLMELLTDYKKDYNIFYLIKNKFLNNIFVQLFNFLKW